MQDNRLTASLTRLRHELAKIASHQSAERERVDHLIAQIESHSASNPGVPPHPSVLANLKDSLRRFEVTHPSLTACVGEVASALSSMGI
jgi:hypothetical protein